MKRIAVGLLVAALLAATGCTYGVQFRAKSSVDGQIGLDKSHVTIRVPEFYAEVGLHAPSWNFLSRLLRLPEIPVPGADPTE